MLIFIDTEFTDFVQIDLISIALVADDGREFYAERTDYRHEDCSDFVRAAVVPMLGRIASSACTRIELAKRLRAWFEALAEPATLVFDCSTDRDLLVDVYLGDEFDAPLANVGDQLLLGEVGIDPVYQAALNQAHVPRLPRHQALADARAMRAGYRAWAEAIK